MSLLIGLIVAMATLTAIITATAQHAPVGVMLQTQARIAAKNGIEKVDAGMARYVRANLDATGIPIVPPTGTDLAPLLSPAYMFLPAAPQGSQWVLQSAVAFGTQAFYACIAPIDASEALPETKRALEQVQQHYPERYFLGDACGATSNYGAKGDHATYWFIPSHAV